MKGPHLKIYLCDGAVAHFDDGKLHLVRERFIGRAEITLDQKGIERLIVYLIARNALSDKAIGMVMKLGLDKVISKLGAKDDDKL